MTFISWVAKEKNNFRKYCYLVCFDLFDQDILDLKLTEFLHVELALLLHCS